MPKFTVRQFCVAMGLEEEGTDYLGAITLLKTLVKHGAAKEAGKVNASRMGRKSILYELPDPIILPIPQTISVPATIPTVEKVEEPVAEETQVVEQVLEVRQEESNEPVVAGNFTYDYGDEDE